MAIQDCFTFTRTGHFVKNRTVLAAMTNKQSNADGTISMDEIDWLARRAEGGFGIITSAATHVSKDGQGWDGEFGVFDDLHIKGLKNMTNTLRRKGTISIAQIFHGGMRSPERLTGVTPLSASRNKCSESFSGFSRAALKEDIIRLISDFSDAALRCVKSGFDGIEIHGAHGYLISQFLGTKTNRRKDEWGGDINARSKFLIEIIRSIKSKVPDNFIIGVRISPEINNVGINIHESIKLAKILTNEGLDFIHLSCWDSFSRSISEPSDSRLITEWFTSSISNLPPLISTGAVWNSKDANSLIAQGADFIGVARVGIAHPDWPKYISEDNYQPQLPPFSASHLKGVSLSNKFVDYMRSWDNFVLEGK